MVFAAVRRTGAALQFAAGELSEDREVALVAVRQDGLALGSSVFRADRTVVLAAVQRTGAALQFAAGALQRDREVVRAAVWQDGGALEFASEAFRGDQEV